MRFFFSEISKSLEEKNQPLILVLNHSIEKLKISKISIFIYSLYKGLMVFYSEANNYLKRRFSISSYPSFVYFANNTLYEYKGERTIEAWSDFLNGGYKNVDPEEIPLKASTMRDISKQVNVVLNNSSMLSLIILCLCLVSLVLSC